MKAVAGQGRTVLFVSHNMGSIRNLCSRAIWMTNGHNEQDGASSDVVSAYLQRSFSPQELIEIPTSAHHTVSSLQIETLEFLDQSGNPSNLLLRGQDLVMRFGFRAKETLSDVVLGCEIFSGGQVLASFAAPPCEVAADHNLQHTICRVPGGTLLPGSFEIHVGARVHGTHKGLDWVPDAATFSISNVADDEDTGRDLRKRGLVDLPQSWEFSSSEARRKKGTAIHETRR